MSCRYRWGVSYVGNSAIKNMNNNVIVRNSCVKLLGKQIFHRRQSNGFLLLRCLHRNGYFLLSNTIQLELYCISYMVMIIQTKQRVFCIIATQINRRCLKLYFQTLDIFKSIYILRRLIDRQIRIFCPSLRVFIVSKLRK